MILSAGLKKAFQYQNGHNRLISLTPPSTVPVFHHMLFPLQIVSFVCVCVCVGSISVKGLRKADGYVMVEGGLAFPKP